MRQPQSALGFIPMDDMPPDKRAVYLRLGRVMTVHYERNRDNSIRPGTVDVDLYQDNKLTGKTRNCLVATSRSGFHLASKDKPYGRNDLPKEGDNVLVLYMDGLLDRPVVILSLHNFFDDLSVILNERLTDPEDYVNRRIDVHESQFWTKLNKIGNFEMHLPDGGFIQMVDDEGSAEFPTSYNGDDTPPDDEDLSEKWGQNNEDQKFWVINHPSGTWVRINDDGSVEIVTKGNMNYQVNGNLKEYVTGNVEREIGGNLTEIIHDSATQTVTNKISRVSQSNNIEDKALSGTLLNEAATLHDKATGSLTTEAGGSHTTKGASINHV